MNILIIHNRYSTSGGEESVVEMQEKLFRANSHNVYTYFRSHGEMKNRCVEKVVSFFTSLVNFSAINEIKKIVEERKIDVAFIHNLYPFISPAILPMLHKRGVKTILFTHNYRLVCPTGLFFRNGIVCEKCGKCVREINAVIYKCEGSVLGSIAHAARNFSARIFRLYKNNIDCYAALTEFQRQKLISYGFDGDKIAVVPNFTTFVENHNVSKRNGKVLFVGRLSSEKGYDILFSAASKLPTVDFTVAGGCSSPADLSGKPHNVTLLGAVDRKRLIELYSTHSLLAITSRCYEAFPLTILEAAMNHCPVIAPNLGAMKSIIKDNETGALFAPFSSDDLAEKIDLLLKDTITAEKLAARSYEVCMKLYSPENYYNTVVSLISLIEQPLHQK